MTVNQRVKKVRSDAGKSQIEMAAALGIKQGSYSDIERGRSNVSGSVRLVLQTKFNVNLSWLDTGKGEPYIGGSIGNGASEPFTQYNAKPFAIDGDRSNMFIVPIKAFGGFLTGYESRVFLDSLQKVPCPWIHGECFAFEIEGFSMYVYKEVDGIMMEKGYPPHSFAIGTPIEGFANLAKGKDYIFQTTEGIVIKTFVKLDDKLCHLKALNSEYNPVAPVPLKSIKRVYYIEQTMKKQG